MPLEERNAWILMERIFPPTSEGYMIRSKSADAEQSALKLVQMVSELGIFGACIG